MGLANTSLVRFCKASFVISVAVIQICRGHFASYVGAVPNITGSISVSRRLNAPVSGAFNSAVDGSGDGAEKSSTGMVKFDSTISFNAAYGGGWGIYGASNTVQPPAFQTLIIIKI